MAAMLLDLLPLSPSEGECFSGKVISFVGGPCFPLQLSYTPTYPHPQQINAYILYVTKDTKVVFICARWFAINKAMCWKCCWSNNCSKSWLAHHSGWLVFKCICSYIFTATFGIFLTHILFPLKKKKNQFIVLFPLSLVSSQDETKMSWFLSLQILSPNLWFCFVRILTHEVTLVVWKLVSMILP